MKKLFHCLMAISALISTACNNDCATKHGDYTNSEAEQYETTQYGRVVSSLPYTEYSLDGTLCEWNFTDDFDQIFDVVIVNSDEELSNYIKSDNAASYPNIDFTKQSLIITHGCSASGIESIHLADFTKLSDSDYKIIIEIKQTLASVMSPWVYAFSVDKISDDTQVELGIVLK